MKNKIKESIFDSLKEENKSQAKIIVKYFRDKGFKGSSEEAYCFIITCLKLIYNKKYSDTELNSIITDGDLDESIDAIVFKKNSIDLFDFKEQDNIGANDLKNLIGSLTKNFLSEKPTDFSLCTRLKKQINKWHSPKNTIKEINVYIIRKQYASKKGLAVDSLIGEIKKLPNINLILLTVDELVSKLLENDFLKIWSINKSLSVRLWPTTEKKDYPELILKINLKELLDLYKKHLDNNKDLFANNIRIPQKNQTFQNGILGTINDNPDSLFLFHNGITITATNILTSAKEYLISEPQVVNGAQTLGNLYTIFEKKTVRQKIK